RTQRTEARLRSRPVRRVHGHRPRPRSPFVRDADRHGRRRGDHDPRRAGDGGEAASFAAGIHRRTGGAVRLLPERRDPDGEGVSRSEAQGHRGGAPAGACERVVPLLHARPHAAGDQEVSGEAGMTTRMPTAVDRRAFLQMSGALVVSFSAASILDAADVVQGPFDTRRSHVDPTQLDSWLAVGADGGVTAYTGKCEFGQGMYTAQIQLVAEALSVPVSRVKLIQCDTSICPDQGTTSGSQSTPTNFNERNLAQAAATAREALLRLAAARLAVPVEPLTIADGVISAGADRTTSVSYGGLVGGRRVDVTLTHS